MNSLTYEALEPRRLYSTAPALAIADVSVAEGNDGVRLAAVAT